MALTASCARLWRFRVLDSPLYHPPPHHRPFARSSFDGTTRSDLLFCYESISKRSHALEIGVAVATAGYFTEKETVRLFRCHLHGAPLLIRYYFWYSLMSEIRIRLRWLNYLLFLFHNELHLCNTVSGLVSYFINYRVLTTISWKSCE